jgi:hypothetical protein
MTLRSMAAVAVAVLAMALPSAASAAPVTVNLRVEGASQTLFEGPVTTYAHDVEAPSDTTARRCDGTNNSANPTPGATALTALVDGLSTVGTSWDGTWLPEFDDYSVTRIGPDSQTPTEFWGLLDNWQFTPVSGCEDEVREGDQVLWAYDAFNAIHFLKLTAPTTTVAPGQALTVRVTDGMTGSAVSGAQVAPVSTDPVDDYETVETSAPSTVTTDSSGEATLSWSTPGWQRVKAAAPNSIRSNRLDICVTPCGPPPADTQVRAAGPTTTDNVPGSWQAHDVPVTLTATDPFSAVTATYYTVGVDPPDPTTASSLYDPADKPVLTDGEEIKYFSVDAGGVTEPVRTSTVAQVDTAPPTTTDNVPTGFTSGPDTVTLTPDDGAGSGVAATYYTVGVDPPDPTTASSLYDPADKPVLTDGEEIKYFSVDNVGNVEDVRTSAVARVDTVPPMVTITAPTNGQPYVLGSIVNATYGCTDPGGPGIAGCSGTTAAGQPLPTDTLGANTFTVTATDTVGLKTTDTVSYLVIPPKLQLTVARHVRLATTRSTIPVGCHLSAGPLRRCTVTLRSGHTTIATGNSTTGRVRARLTKAGIGLLTARRNGLTATITATGRPLVGSVSAHAETTIALHA